jgi:hypothetical protein
MVKIQVVHLAYVFQVSVSIVPRILIVHLQTIAAKVFAQLVHLMLNVNQISVMKELVKYVMMA